MWYERGVNGFLNIALNDNTTVPAEKRHINDFY